MTKALFLSLILCEAYYCLDFVVAECWWILELGYKPVSFRPTDYTVLHNSRLEQCMIADIRRAKHLSDYHECKRKFTSIYHLKVQYQYSWC